jgi:plasmid stabilization system protein ParE
MKIVYTDRANEELDAAVAWYESKRKGLGFEFLESVEEALKRLMMFPELCAVCYDNFRRCVIKRFPYAIFYTLENQDIVIHAVFNSRRNPEDRPFEN